MLLIVVGICRRRLHPLPFRNSIFTARALGYNTLMQKFLKHIPWWLVILVVAAALIAIGIAGGGFEAAARKASLICYECIGIG